MVRFGKQHLTRTAQIIGPRVRQPTIYPEDKATPRKTVNFRTPRASFASRYERSVSRANGRNQGRRLAQADTGMEND